MKMDFADVINQLSDHMSNDVIHIKGLVAHPNLTGFHLEQTDMTLLPLMYVQQQGDADHGFYGQIYFPTTYPNGDGGFMHLNVEFYG